MEKTEFINIIFDGLALIVLIGLLLLSPILLENLLWKHKREGERKWD